MKTKPTIYICDKCGVEVHGKVDAGIKCAACKRGVLEATEKQSGIDVGNRVFYDYSTLKKRTAIIQIRVVPTDKTSIQKAAQALNLTVTDYLLTIHYNAEK